MKIKSSQIKQALQDVAEFHGFIWEPSVIQMVILRLELMESYSNE